LAQPSDPNATAPPRGRFESDEQWFIQTTDAANLQQVIGGVKETAL
jgi:hypothetical protein